MLNVVVLSLVPQRDWIVDQMISDELKRRGHNACVRNYLQDGRAAILAEKPDVVVMPVVRCEYSRDFAKRLKSWNIRVIARRSEAGVSRNQFDKLSPHWQLDQIGRYEYKDLIDLELVWSREFADILIERGRLRSGQERIIGGITLDPYFKYDLVKSAPKALTKKTDWIKERKFDPSKKTLFFCTGFVNADRHGYCLPEAPAGDPIHKELQERDAALRKIWLDAIAEISGTKKYNLLVRPHQGELFDAYRSLKGVCVSVEGTAGESLYYSDCMIHCGSTMAVEAHLLEKPAFLFGSTAQDELIRDISPYCKDKKELLDAIAGVKWNQSNARIKGMDDLQAHFYGPIDGKAHIRCADAVCEFDFDPKFTPPIRSIPSQWPRNEYQDYSTPGVIRISSEPVIVCGVCKKQFQNLTGQRSVRCPHCSIMMTQNICVSS